MNRPYILPPDCTGSRLANDPPKWLLREGYEPEPRNQHGLTLADVPAWLWAEKR